MVPALVRMASQLCLLPAGQEAKHIARPCMASPDTAEKSGWGCRTAPRCLSGPCRCCRATPGGAPACGQTPRWPCPAAAQRAARRHGGAGRSAVCWPGCVVQPGWQSETAAVGGRMSISNCSGRRRCCCGTSGTGSSSAAHQVDEVEARHEGGRQLDVLHNRQLRVVARAHRVGGRQHCGTPDKSMPVCSFAPDGVHTTGGGTACANMQGAACSSDVPGLLWCAGASCCAPHRWCVR